MWLSILSQLNGVWLPQVSQTFEERWVLCRPIGFLSILVLVALILEMRLSAAITGSPNKLVLRPRMTYMGSDTCSLSIDIVPLNCPSTFNVRPVGPCRILEGLVRVTPLRLLNVCSDIAITSAPVSILNCVSVPCSCSLTVQDEVFPESKTPRNAVSRFS